MAGFVCTHKDLEMRREESRTNWDATSGCSLPPRKQNTDAKYIYTESECILHIYVYSNFWPLAFLNSRTSPAKNIAENTTKPTLVLIAPA